MGLLYSRARYYNPAAGVFTALDPFEGMVGRPMSLNGYLYVEGNVVNITDPSGLCPRLDGGMEARECEFLRDDLRVWGVNAVYDIGRDVLEPGSSCLPEQCELAINQAQGVRQRYTLGEMSAIHSAVRIFRAAQTNIGFAPLNGAITVQKKYEAGDVNVQQEMAFGLTVGNTITLSARWWGEGRRTGTYTVNGKDETVQSIDSFARDPQQYRSWIVLHEMGHVYTTERGIDLQALYTQQLPPVFRTLGYFPTRYANNADPKEYMIEAITGVWWNSGYSTIQGYDSGAGGRTSPLDIVFQGEDWDDYIFLNTPNLTTDDPNDTFPLVVLNVGSNIWRQIGASSSLQDWILNNIFSQ